MNQLPGENFNCTNPMDKANKNCCVHNLGFSFHDEYPLFEEILEDSEHFTLCLIQLNYMDTEYQAGVKGLKLAYEKGLAVVIMEPIKGGKLAVTPPNDAQKVWMKSKDKRTPADWALQWVWNQEEVSVVLSGMNSMPQVVENVKSAENLGGQVNMNVQCIMQPSTNPSQALLPQ